MGGAGMDGWMGWGGGGEKVGEWVGEWVGGVCGWVGEWTVENAGAGPNVKCERA